MATRTRSTTNDQVSTSSSKSRASSRQMNSSINQINDYRLQEKKELQTCNNRLANLIHKERELDKERQNLHEQLRITTEDCEAKIEECKSYYEEQLAHLRQKLEVEFTGSAKRVHEFEKLKTSLKESQKENSVLVADLKLLEKKNSNLSIEVDKLRDKLNQLNLENEKLNKLIQNIEIERNEFEKAAKKNLAQSEAEKLRSIGLEGRLKALEEKITSERHFHQREIEELREKYDEDIDEHIQEAIDNEVERLNTEQMMKSRRDFEEKASQIKLDYERKYSEDLAKLKDQLSKSISNEKQSMSKLNSLQSLVDKLNAKIQDFNQNESILNSRIAELEGLLEVEKNEKQELIEIKNREIRELEEELKSKDTENQLVLDTNVQLNEEIRIYRNLLDEHEKSLESSDLNSSSQTKQARATSPTAKRRFSQANRKRKRQVIVDQVNETTIVNKSVGPIAIDDSTDFYIRLVNRTDLPVSIGNWELKRENNENGYSFKFVKSFILDPSQSVTVYSADAEDAVHNPPVTLKLKKNWPIGGVTTLVNEKKEEIARWEWTLRSKRSRLDSSGDEANRSCSLM